VTRLILSLLAAGLFAPAAAADPPNKKWAGEGK
jgi:hypothetical protein